MVCSVTTVSDDPIFSFSVGVAVPVTTTTSLSSCACAKAGAPWIIVPARMRQVVRRVRLRVELNRFIRRLQMEPVPGFRRRQARNVVKRNSPFERPFPGPSKDDCGRQVSWLAGQHRCASPSRNTLPKILGAGTPVAVMRGSPLTVAGAARALTRFPLNPLPRNLSQAG